MIPRPPRATRTDTLFTYTTLFRSPGPKAANGEHGLAYLSHFSTLCWSLGSPPKTSIRISQTRSPRADRRRLRLHAALQQEPGVEACSNCAGPIAASASKFGRSEERRVGNECVSTCRSRWSLYP